MQVPGCLLQEAGKCEASVDPTTTRQGDRGRGGGASGGKGCQRSGRPEFFFGNSLVREPFKTFGGFQKLKISVIYCTVGTKKYYFS